MITHRCTPAYCQQAYTLVELLITLAIIGMLISTSITSYRQYVFRGRISDALTELTSLRNEVAAELAVMGEYDSALFPSDYSSSVIYSLRLVQSIYNPPTSGQGRNVATTGMDSPTQAPDSQLPPSNADNTPDEPPASSPSGLVQVANPGDLATGSAGNPFAGNGRLRVFIIAEIEASLYGGDSGTYGQLRLEADLGNPQRITWRCGYPGDMPEAIIPLNYLPELCRQPVSLSGRDE